MQSYGHLYDVDEGISVASAKSSFSCVYRLLCISTVGCACHISILIEKMKVTGALASASCVPLVLSAQWDSSSLIFHVIKPEILKVNIKC